MLLGYLSDSFGRRQVLLVTLAAMAVFNIVSGLVVSPGQLFLMRALVNVTTGAIGTLVGTALSDFTTLEVRVKYQGYAGVGTAIGGTIGALSGAGLAMYSQWRVFYYGIQAPLTLIGLIMVGLWVPSSLPTPSLKEVWRMAKTIDVVGIASLTGTVACGAIVLSQGGRIWPWREPRMIALVVLLAISAITFSVAGFKNFRGVRPIIPFDIFRNQTVSIVCTQQFLLGGAYWVFLFFTPVYLQLVQAWDPLESAALMLPFLFTHGVWSAVSGSLMRWTVSTGHGEDATMISYRPMMWFGFTCCMAGLAFFCSADGNTQTLQIVLMEVIFGLGTGSTFTNSIAALQAHTPEEQAAVVIGARAVIRGVGGSVFSAVGALLMAEVLKRTLPEGYKQLADHAFSRPPLGDYSESVRVEVAGAWTKGIRWIYGLAAITMSVALLLTLWIKDDGLKSVEPKDRNRRMSVEHV